jgi:hypothetical protein
MNRILWSGLLALAFCAPPAHAQCCSNGCCVGPGANGCGGSCAGMISGACDRWCSTCFCIRPSSVPPITCHSSCDCWYNFACHNFPCMPCLANMTCSQPWYLRYPGACAPLPPCAQWPGPGYVPPPACGSTGGCGLGCCAPCGAGGCCSYGPGCCAPCGAGGCCSYGPAGCASYGPTGCAPGYAGPSYWYGH